MATYIYPALSVSTLPPVGGATSVNQVATNDKLDSLISLSTKAISDKIFFDYTGVSNTGYTEILAATSNAIKAMTWFESSGQPMIIAIGASGAEVDLAYVPAGGFNGEIPINIPTATRISIKQLNTDALSSGIYLISNLYK